MRFSDHRRQYTLGGLRRADLAEDPVAQFVAWQDQAIAAGLADPTACVLATLQPDQTLRQRMVLMKGVDARGLMFYTNYRAAKRRRSQSAIKPRCCSPGMNSTGRYR